MDTNTIDTNTVDGLIAVLDEMSKATGRHYTIFAFSGGYKAMFGTPNLDTGSGRDQVADLPQFKTLIGALRWLVGQDPASDQWYGLRYIRGPKPPRPW